MDSVTLFGKQLVAGQSSPFNKNYTYAIALPRYSTPSSVLMEMKIWCRSCLLETELRNRWFFHNDLNWFVFQNEADAMLFKLTWQGVKVDYSEE